MSRFVVGQKVYVSGLPQGNQYNGSVGIVMSLPGSVLDKLDAYTVSTPTDLIAIVERNLSPYPPVLPNGRGDTDKPSTWAEFDRITGLRSSDFRFRGTEA